MATGTATVVSAAKERSVTHAAHESRGDRRHAQLGRRCRCYWWLFRRVSVAGRVGRDVSGTRKALRADGMSVRKAAARLQRAAHPRVSRVASLPDDAALGHIAGMAAWWKRMRRISCASALVARAGPEHANQRADSSTVRLGHRRRSRFILNANSAKKNAALARGDKESASRGDGRRGSQGVTRSSPVCRPNAPSRRSVCTGRRWRRRSCPTARRSRESRSASADRR